MRGYVYRVRGDHSINRRIDAILNESINAMELATKMYRLGYENISIETIKKTEEEELEK